MSNRSWRTLGARVLVLSLVLGALGLFNTGSTLAAKNKGAATPNAQTGKSQLTGQLIATGSVTVNGNKAITGTTVYPDSRIAVDCAKRNSAIVNLGKLGRIELTAGAKLTLRFGEGLIAGELTEGKALISTPPGVKVAVNTPDGVTSGGGVDAAVTPIAAPLNARCDPGAAGSPGQAGTIPPGRSRTGSPGQGAPAGAPAGAPGSFGGFGVTDAVFLGVLGGAGVAAGVDATSNNNAGAIPLSVSPTRP